MKSEHISNAMGNIDDELIVSAEKIRKEHKKKKSSLFKWFIAAACFCMVMIYIFGGKNFYQGIGNLNYVIAKAEYPKMVPYPEEDGQGYEAWRESRNLQLSQPEGYRDGFHDFVWKMSRQFLKNAGTENRVYSPLNIYMALSILAEITDHSTRQEILSLLAVDTIEDLRTKTSALWNANYCNDGAVTSILANSLWLNQNIRFKKPVMDTLASIYYTSSYQGKMGSRKFNLALQNWLNEQTGGLLKEQTEGVELNDSIVLALASTIYFQAKWADEFWKEETKKEIFHAKDGDKTCKFMHQRSSQTYFWGKNFSAIAKSLEGSGYMWLILPDEGVSIEELLLENEMTELFYMESKRAQEYSEKEWKNKKYLMVNISMPKFDVSSDINLIDGLKELGITEIFDDKISDFSPITNDNGIYISQISHAARVMTDEEGCMAAAYTAMLVSGEGMPPGKEVDFVLDRPFLFIITGTDNTELFAGVVNQPI